MSVFVRRGTAFWLPTAAGTVRERNVRREPWLTMTVTEGDRDAHIVVLSEGSADVVGSFATIWTWSSVPLTASATPPISRTMPPT